MLKLAIIYCRTFNIVKRNQVPVWNFIYAYWRSVASSSPSSSPPLFPSDISQALPDPDVFGLDGALTCLREFPLELIDWPVNNTQRIDYMY
jgi:hypothetical protein